MGARVTKETLYLRHEYTNDERLEMGTKLAEAHNRIAEIEAEEAVMKAQIKDRKAGVELSIGHLSRSLSSGFAMENIDCDIVYDSPNVGEVSYKRKDNGEIAKTRAMTAAEMQQELDFNSKLVEMGPVAVEDSAKNIENFFGEGSIDAMKAEDAGNSAIINAEKDQEAVFANPDPAAAAEAIKPEHDAAWNEGRPAKPGRGRPKGSTNKKQTDREMAEAF